MMPSHAAVLGSHETQLLQQVQTLPGPGLGPRQMGPAQPDNAYTVILASGREDGGKRATLALSMACTALSMDMNTHLFMIGDGSYWAYQGHAHGIQVDGFPALEELLDSFSELGGHLALCSTCHAAICHAPDNRDGLPLRRNGVQINGMATVMEQVLRGRAITF
jgi:predicted peroxiredoxin